MKEPIRILHVLYGMDMGGTETLLMNLYRNIDRSLIQFDFAVSAERECFFDKEILSNGGRIFQYPRYRGINHHEYCMWWESFLREHKEYKIVHGHIGSTASIYLSIAKAQNRFAIAHSHSTDGVISLHQMVYKILSYRTRYIADYFFGCSEQALIDRYGQSVASNRRVSRVLRNGIDAQKYEFDEAVRNEIRREYGVSKTEDFILGTVGRLTKQKNPHQVIRICSELHKRGMQFSFWWFGAGEMKEEIERLLEKEGLTNIVRLMGTRQDINKVLQGMDAFIFPSQWEGLGIACIEAQAAGLPTLCSEKVPREAGITTLCEFLPPRNTNAWCNHIISIKERVQSDNYIRPREYSNIKENGYDIASVADELMEFYYEAESSVRDE